jgi:WD40 repeat protein
MKQLPANIVGGTGSKTLTDSKTLPESSAATALGSSGPPAPKVEIRDHELISCVGRGSYGEVWLARNVMGTYRAVKIVARAAFEHARPFEREFNGIKKFEPLSRSHDGFIDILQVGRTEEYFYYVMELADDQVTGQQIDPEHYAPKSLRSEMKERKRLPFEKCVELGISLTQALGHLHRHGLIHRDIKPSNIIFVNGILKLADIGLVAEQSEAKSFVGTEGFIPPEGPGTAQADIYSLGKVLYEIATGKDRHEFPALPTLLGEDETDTHLLELNSVFLKACQGEVKLRYQTAEEMRDDLLLLQSGKSVKQAQETERRLGWLMRASAVGMAITVLALAGIFVVNRQAKREAALRARAQLKEQEARQTLINQYVANGEGKEDDGDLGAAVDWYVKALEIETDPVAVARQRFRIGAALHMMPKLVQLMKHEGVVNDVVFNADGRLVASGSDDKTARVWDTATGVLSIPPLEHTNKVRRVLFSPDGERLLSVAGELTQQLGSGDSAGTGEVRLWDLRSGNLIADVPHPDYVAAAEFGKEGKSFVTGCFDGLVRVCDARTGKIGKILRHPDQVLALSLSADGDLVASCCRTRLRLWELSSGRCLFTNVVGAARDIAISPDRRTYSAIMGPTGAAVYRVEDGFPIMTIPDPYVREGGALSYSAEGRRLLLGTWDQHFNVYDVVTGTKLTTISYAAKVANLGVPFGASFSPDGRNVVTWGGEGQARIWSSRNGRQSYPALHHHGPITMATFSPESRCLVTGGADGYVKIWDLASDASLEFQHPHYKGIGEAKWSPDGKRILLGGGDALGGVWDLATGKPVGEKISHDPAGFTGASWSRDGRRLVTADASGSLLVWNGDSIMPLTPPIQILTNKWIVAQISPDGERIAVGGDLTEARILEASSGKQLFAVAHGQTGPGLRAGFTSKGRWLFTLGVDGVVRLWNPTTGASVLKAMRHKGPVTGVCSSSDESRLATASEDGTVVVWEIPIGRATLPPLRHRDKVSSVVFSPDNRRLLTASEDGTVCVWDAESGRKQLTINLGGAAWHAIFNRNGKYIATASARGARLWDGLTGEPLSPWLTRAEALAVRASDIQFAPGDDRLANWGWLTAGGSGMPAGVWNLQPDSRQLELLQAHALVLGGEAPGRTTFDLVPAWAKLKATCPERVAVSQEQALCWHRALAEWCYVASDRYGLTAHTRPLCAAYPEDRLLRRWAAGGLLNQGRALEALATDPDVLPLRSSAAPPGSLDLSHVFNRCLSGPNGVLDHGEELVRLEPGVQTMGGVQFDVRGAIMLGGLAELFMDGFLDPTNAPTIPVNRGVSRFHMLQFAYFETTEGTPIGRYVLHYADGENRELPIRYGPDIRNFWYGTQSGDSVAEASGAVVVWRGESRNASGNGASIRLFKRTYENPRPNVEVVSIGFESTMTPCSPVLMAVTVE